MSLAQVDLSAYKEAFQFPPAQHSLDYDAAPENIRPRSV